MKCKYCSHYWPNFFDYNTCPSCHRWLDQGKDDDEKEDNTITLSDINFLKKVKEETGKEWYDLTQRELFTLFFKYRENEEEKK